MDKIKILNVLFWVSLVVGIVMVLWRIFGNSPSDLQVVAPFFVMGAAKMWDVNEKQIRLEMGTRNGFDRMKQDINLMKQDINLVKENIGSMELNVNLIKERLEV